MPEDPDEPHRPISYAELRDEVCRTANALRALGIGKGDMVGIYMGMVPELPVAMLACARIGAPHVVVFGGFSAGSLGERLESTGARLLITQDEAWRKGSAIPLKRIADEAIGLAPTRRAACWCCAEAAPRCRCRTAATSGGTTRWTAQPAECEPEPVEAEHTLFCLHTSGTTAKPKAAVHTTGGYLTYAAITHRWVFDIQDGDVWWCAADVGWVTGHSYIVYGPLNNGATSVLYEGDPMYPGRRPPLADHRALRGDPVLHGPDADPRLHQGRPRAPARRTTCRRCGCWARSASRSTRRPGCGTGSTSAAAAARWSTPGGRPRPAAS